MGATFLVRFRRSRQISGANRHFEYGSGGGSVRLPSATFSKFRASSMSRRTPSTPASSAGPTASHSRQSVVDGSPALSAASEHGNTSYSTALLQRLRQTFHGEQQYSGEQVFLSSAKKGGFLSTIDSDSVAANVAKRKESIFKFSQPVTSYNSIRETIRIDRQASRSTNDSKTSVWGYVMLLLLEVKSLWTGLWRLLRTKEIQALFMYGSLIAN